jgi:hypothetical protein
MDRTATEKIGQARGTDFGLDIQRIRDDFPMLKTKVNGKQMIYFDSAATNYKPQCVIDRLSELYSSKYAKTQEQRLQSSSTQRDRKKLYLQLEAHRGLTWWRTDLRKPFCSKMMR